jgi:uncharacterized protein (DUF433 family)
MTGLGQLNNVSKGLFHAAEVEGACLILTGFKAIVILQSRNDLFIIDQQKEKSVKETLKKHIRMDARIMGGKPIIRGTRIPVALIVKMLAQGVSEKDLLQEYPRLQPADIRAALEYAARLLAHEEVMPLSHSK